LYDVSQTQPVIFLQNKCLLKNGNKDGWTNLQKKEKEREGNGKEKEQDHRLPSHTYRESYVRKQLKYNVILLPFAKHLISSSTR
jgi:hypothetical protein